jgi:hypothetical protein
MIYFIYRLQGNMPAIFVDCALHVSVQTSLLFQRLLVADYVPRAPTGNTLNLVTYSTARIHRPITMYFLSEGIKSRVPWYADITQYSGNSFGGDFMKSQQSLSISMAVQPLRALAAIQSPDLFTIITTPWMSDQLVARPLPKHRTA